MIHHTLTEVLSQHYDSNEYEISNILYEKNDQKLSIEVLSKEHLTKNQQYTIAESIEKRIPFLKKVVFSSQVILSGASPQERWQEFLVVLKKKNPAVASILRVSKISFEENSVKIIFKDEGLQKTFERYEVDKFMKDFYKTHYEISIVIEIKAEADLESSISSFIEKQDEIIKDYVLQNTKAIPQDFKPTVKTESDKSKGNGGNGGKKEGYRKKEKSLKKSDNPNVIYKKVVAPPYTPVNDMIHEGETYSMEGELIQVDTRDIKNGKVIFKMILSDHTNAISAKAFLKSGDYEEIKDDLKPGKWYKVEGVLQYDPYEKANALQLRGISKGKIILPREDNAEEKRVELHLHTQMSEMDGMASVKNLINTAKAWGHKAIAITDHGVLQAFPDAAKTAGDDIKVIYGMEGYLVNDLSDVIEKPGNHHLEDEFIVFDIETTGLSNKNEKITEIGAVRVKDLQVVDRFNMLINPEKTIPENIIELTGITNDMVKDKETIEKVLPKFLAFAGDTPLIAHNASFDMGFIRFNAEKLDIKIENAVIDTLALARLFVKDIKRHNLKALCKYFKVSLENHHRAEDDAKATAEVFIKMVEMMKSLDVHTLNGINEYSARNNDYKALQTYHVIILAKNYTGLKNLYELVSHSNLNTFHKKPRIQKSLLQKKREGLIIGSACEAGELYKSIIDHQPTQAIERIADFYDYLEIQPIGNNEFMVRNEKVKNHRELELINQQIVDLGDKLGKPVVGTCDVHFLNPEDEVYRRILMAGKGFSDADEQAPLYFRTTEEMLKEFEYLGNRAKEIVIDNTNLVASWCDDIIPVPKGTFPPVIEGSDDELRDSCVSKAKKLYGEPLPEIVEKRLTRELNSIIGNGYAVMYIIARKLVLKSLEDGFLVGSRGSVGSSFAATMSDITEVNPLPAHYLCGNKTCKYSEFITDGSYSAGVDLPDKDCPSCGQPLIKEGHDIPFETFLGFDGDKEPDIDLNFAGIYQANAHKYTEVLFGEGKTFKAGTIGTIADKTAFGYVKNYFDERGINISSHEVVRLSQGITGVKRTSGQHPGGIMVVPDTNDIHEFCPIQFPANDVTSDVITTHFDYHSISGRLLKLDILGHDVPTIIKYLEEMTGVDIFDVKLDDRPTMEIFLSTKSLKIVDEDYKEELGSLGIPEFGTKFVRQMLKDTKPKTFSDLVRISGLSHGTDVWLNNAQDLVRNNVVTIAEVISTRDDIMNYLLLKDLDPLRSFKIMEDVRKGKGLKEEYIEDMKAHDVPDWYISSCQTIKYMFPKAHAVAYVMMSVRIAYFKVHHPLAFYATFFTIKVDDFDADLISKGKMAIRRAKSDIQKLEKPSKKEQDLFVILEIADEMYSRGFEVSKVSLHESKAEKFILKEGKILPPFRALQGVGESAAYNLEKVAAEGEFLSKNDLRAKAKLSKTVIETLTNHGCLEGLPDDNQLSFF